MAKRDLTAIAGQHIEPEDCDRIHQHIGELEISVIASQEGQGNGNRQTEEQCRTAPPGACQAGKSCLMKVLGHISHPRDDDFAEQTTRSKDHHHDDDCQGHGQFKFVADERHIGADQILECDGALFDKPNGRAGAVTHLQNLSGKLHRLITSACVVQGGEVQWQSTDGVRLTMRELSADFIESYLDAAGDGVLATVGAYRLEDIGAQLFTRVEGDYFTVLGLPLLPLLQFLRDRKVLPE